jgi:hypothetical protein
MVPSLCSWLTLCISFVGWLPLVILSCLGGYTVFAAGFVEETIFFSLWSLGSLPQGQFFVCMDLFWDIMFHCSVCFFFPQYHTVLITVDL